jgi:hypothetical protein
MEITKLYIKNRNGDYSIMIYMSTVSDELMTEIITWCNHEFGNSASLLVSKPTRTDRWSYYRMYPYAHFYFNNENDELYFRMRWDT